ncbi:MAG: hypothetical protein NTX50_29885, partial [Candidatus Sumerlaeota bacterium]|nr:hypothetical protein [Candidatus Sumerlaeota bacterium]
MKPRQVHQREQGPHNNAFESCQFPSAQASPFHEAEQRKDAIPDFAESAVLRLHRRISAISRSQLNTLIHKSSDIFEHKGKCNAVGSGASIWSA